MMTAPPGLSPADDRHQAVMRAALDAAAQHFKLALPESAVFGWKDRTIGARAMTGDDEAVWLRVVSELSTWAEGEFWEGNKDAARIRGVRKPDVLRTFDWKSDDRWFRSEIMTYLAEPVVSATPDLRDDPRLPGQWWKSLRSSLDALGDHRTERVPLSQPMVTRRLRQYFVGLVDPVVKNWVTAHNDMHWNNLTQPGCYLLDWEGWGTAPVGYDAATLYCHSLLVPDVAARIYDEFSGELNTPDGVRSQLLAIARMLDRSGHGDYPELVPALHALADKLTRR
jgi:hypothetical protein